MTDIAALVTRLRKYAYSSEVEAADALEACQAEIDSLGRQMLHFGELAEQERNHWKARAEKAEAERDEATDYAKRLAVVLWEKHWRDDAPQWQPLPDLIGILTQIDNMTAGLVRAEKAEAEIERLRTALDIHWNGAIAAARVAALEEATQVAKRHGEEVSNEKIGKACSRNIAAKISALKEKDQ